MAYAKLSDMIPVTAVGSIPQLIYVSNAGTKAAVAALEFHNWDINNTGRTLTMYVVPASGTNPGVGSQVTQLVKTQIQSLETILFEPKFPYVLTTNDSIQVLANGTGINTLVKGSFE